MRRSLAAAALAVVASVGFVQPASASTLFIDNFTGPAGTKPDATKWSEWSSCTYNGSAAYGKIGCGERATLDGAGHLQIPATPTLGTSISTKDHSRFTTGLFEARMKIDTPSGYWPAFWMLNNRPAGSPNYPRVGEVDALEAYTYYSDGYRRAVHNYSPAKGGVDQSWSGSENPLCGNGNVKGAWHTYGAKVENTQVTFYFDGVQCGAPVLSTEGGGKPWNFGSGYPYGLWPILTNAVDTVSGAPAPTASSTLLVDWVKVTR